MANVNVLLFPEFETLDAFGPVELLGRIPEYELHYVYHMSTESINKVDFSGIPRWARGTTVGQ